MKLHGGHSDIHSFAINVSDVASADTYICVTVYRFWIPDTARNSKRQFESCIQHSRLPVPRPRYSFDAAYRVVSIICPELTVFAQRSCV